MKKSDDKKKLNGASQQYSNDNDKVVDIAIARMKTGAVVKEERKSKFKFIAVTALAIAALAAFSQLDFFYQNPVSETTANGDIVITLKQGEGGHYFATGKINNEEVKFLVDTGATAVSIPMKVAKRLGLPLGEKRRTITANGYGTAYQTAIKSIQLGDIVLTNVEASVTEGLVGEEALLGMSFLGRTKVEQENGVMKITY